MCYIWEDRIERCQHCSETDYRNVLGVILNTGYARPTYQLITHTAQQNLSRSHSQPSRQNIPINLPRDSTTETLFDREQALTQGSQPSTSRDDVLVNEATQCKRQRLDADQPPSFENNTLIEGTAQHGRQRSYVDAQSTPRHDSPTYEQRLPRSQTAFLRQDTRVRAAAQYGQQAKVYNQLAA